MVNEYLHPIFITHTISIHDLAEKSLQTFTSFIYTYHKHLVDICETGSQETTLGPCLVPVLLFLRKGAG